MASKTRFVSTLADRGCWIELRDDNEPIPIEGWHSALSASERNLGAILLQAVDDQRARVEGMSLFLEAASLSQFSDRDLRDANLPPACPFMLELNAKGTLASATFRFEIRWYRADRRRLGPTEIRGIELSAEGQRFVLTDPAYTLVTRVQEFNARPASTLDERLIFWANLCELTGADVNADLRIRPDRYLQNLRVIRAHRFTLELDVDRNGEIEITPVLLNGDAMGSSDSVPSSDAHTSEPLLSPHQQKQFSQNFSALSAGRNKCPIGDGTFVVFDDKLAEALTHIRHLKQADHDTRAAFLANPHGYLRARIAEAGADTDTSWIESVENTYFETEGFSDRVKGIGQWQRPTLPWVQAQTQGWLPPERVHVYVGSQQYEVLTEDVPGVVDRLSRAIQNAEPNIEYVDQTIAATPDAHAAFTDAKSKLEAAANEYLSEKERAAERERRGPFALLGVDDLSSGGYASSRRSRSHSSLDLPLLNSALKPHQEIGVRWLQDRWAAGYRGALLADDMGLGKSLTILAFLKWLQEQIKDGHAPQLPILLVVPTSLLENWINEHRLHLPGLGLGRPAIVYGKELSYYRNDSRRKDIDGGQPSLRTELLRNEPWIITTYETLRDYQISFGKLPLSAVIFDEAQRIKNPGASLKNAAKHMNADFFIAATGTPVENRLADLWSIVDLIEPDYLGSLRDFSRKYEQAPSRELIAELKLKVDHGALSVRPDRSPDPGLMLRRMKDGTLLGLPLKHEHSIRSIMSAAQAQAYDDAIEAARKLGTSHKDVLRALQGILAVSLHPDVGADVPDDEYIAMSARYKSAFEILDRAHANNEKVLIFLEMLEAQTPLAILIQRRYKLASRPMIISGEVPPSQRQQRVDRFQSVGDGFDAMILSPRAGGVGLTLTRANHVIHLSRWWNPAVEDQSTDRVYRIGQDKDVHVYYLQAIHPRHGENSFDAKLDQLLVRKRGLSRDLLSPVICTDDDVQQLYAEAVAAG